MGMFAKGIQFPFQTPDQAQLDGYLFKTLPPSLPAHKAGVATITTSQVTAGKVC